MTNDRLLIIYPGRFQPFHKGHKKIYDQLAKRFNNVFIATSNKVDPPKSPFSFDEKKQMMELTGMDTDNVVMTKNPYLANEITQHFDKNNTVLVFVVSEKDMAENPRFTFEPKKDGSPSYFQPFKSLKSSKPMAQHGYILTMPTYEFDVLGEPVRSATELRAMYKNLSNKQRRRFIKDLFGSYSKDIHKLMNDKLEPLQEGKEGKPSRNDQLLGISDPFRSLDDIKKGIGGPRQKDPHRYRTYGGITGVLQRAIPELQKIIDEMNDLVNAPEYKRKMHPEFMVRFLNKYNAIEQLLDQFDIMDDETMKKLAETQIKDSKISIWEADDNLIAINTKKGYACKINNVVTESMDIITLANSAGNVLRVFFDKKEKSTTIKDKKGGSHTYQKPASVILNALNKRGYKVVQNPEPETELSLVPKDDTVKIGNTTHLPDGGYEMNLMNSMFAESYKIPHKYRIYETNKRKIQSKLFEKWDKEVKTPKSERGKYDGKSLGWLRKELAKLKKSGPHKRRSKEFKKMKELEFAIRAKTGWGKVD